jgi:predicted GNAT family N-acyltransferase
MRGRIVAVVDKGYTFVIASWPRDRGEIIMLRAQIPAEIGSGFSNDDSGDENAWHLLAFNNAGQPVGTARMQRDGRVDYVLVLQAWRGFTVGGAMLSYLRHIATCTRLESIWTVAPASVENFFIRNGFQFAAGEPGAGGTESRKMVRYIERTGEPRAAIH